VVLRSDLPLIAMAVAGLGAFAGAAHADDSLTLYGLMDAGISSYSHIGPTNATATGFEAGGNAPNLWGMKGKEDLGNGTKVIFDLEGSMNLANGVGNGAACGCNSNGNLFGREAYVGLDGSWGTVKAGLQLDPYLIAALITDAADLSESGSALNTLVFSQGITQLNTALIGLFDPNAISYQTPDINDMFHATLLYGFGGVAGNNSASRYYSANAVLHTGPFVADVAYFNFNNAAAVNIDKAWHVGASYKFNDLFKLYASYDDSKTPLGLSATFVLNSSMVTENNQFGVGVGGNFSPNLSYSVGYYREQDKNNTSDRATTLGVQLNYKMSKHTTLYGIVSSLKAGSDGAGSGIVNGYANTAAPGGGLVFPGNTSTGFTLGVTHTF
jgi:predicted porin